MNFFDIGANRGQTFEDFLTKTTKYDGWTIWCFEPSPRHLPQLMENVKQYRDRYKIIICPFGVGAESQFKTFYQKDDPRGDSFHRYLASDHETVNLDLGYELMCPVVGIWEVLELADPVEIKIDAEGSEYQILPMLRRSPLLSRVTALYVEFHDVGQPKELAQELIDAFQDTVPIQPWTF